jgi:hypothetical protein
MRFCPNYCVTLDLCIYPYIKFVFECIPTMKTGCVNG